MKIIQCLSVLYLLLFYSREKQNPSLIENITKNHSSLLPLTQYTIRQGQQFCDKSSFIPVEYAELKFVVKFDSSAIYYTVNPSNQYDINKLYGFSDNDSGHHLYSARFGWRWSDQALRLFAYVYDSGIRRSKELGIVQIGAENNCSVKVTGGHYIFSLNNVTDTILRTSTTDRGKGYKLYPYFGGDETEPHDINILIKEFKPD
ncbi:MAG: hypothetical protein ABJA71_08700 [Ginsengibacter sp.]